MYTYRGYMYAVCIQHVILVPDTEYLPPPQGLPIQSQVQFSIRTTQSSINKLKEKVRCQITTYIPLIANML